MAEFDAMWKAVGEIVTCFSLQLHKKVSGSSESVNLDATENTMTCTIVIYIYIYIYAYIYACVYIYMCVYIYIFLMYSEKICPTLVQQCNSVINKPWSSMFVFCDSWKVGLSPHSKDGCHTLVSSKGQKDEELSLLETMVLVRTWSCG